MKEREELEKNIVTEIKKLLDENTSYSLQRAKSLCTCLCELSVVGRSEVFNAEYEAKKQERKVKLKSFFE